MPDDARQHAARYRADPDAVEEQDHAPSPQRRPEDQSLWVDQQIRAAIARGEFDDLPYAGRPLPHVDTAREPDWWLRRLLEREQVTGVLPEALQLRKDDALLATRLDELRSEDQVRAAVEEFNLRIVAARRQLAGGPPVVTALRDVEAEVDAWRGRRTPRHPEPSPDPTPGPRRWWRRRGQPSKGAGSPAPTRRTSA